MDKRKKWDWLPQEMPGVARKITEMRQTYGAEWMATCWRQGVILGLPGWFWAAEGALAIGVPVDMQSVEQHLRLRAVNQSMVSVWIKQPETV